MEKRLLFKKTLWHIMRLTFVQMTLMAAFCTMVYAHDAKAQEVLNSGVSIKAQSQSLKTILAQIEKQTEARFVYSDTRIPIDKQVLVKANGQTLETVLKELFPPMGVRYQVSGNFIVLSKLKNETAENAAPEEALPPAFTVTGTVTDEKGELLVGASVVLEGTTKGTFTNERGTYILELEDADKTGNLVFSYVGYEKQTVAIAGRTAISIVLKEAGTLSEVVVVGYGTQIRKNLSSSISKVDVEKLNTTAANSFEAALQGQAAGVQVIQGSAMAGSSVNIRIRGSSSVVASSEPLYVIDGIPVEAGAISNSNVGAAVNNFSLQTAANSNVLASLNPNDIESIEILKDASAAAIYGSRGSNGVVLITTKKGKAGRTKVSLSSNFSMSEPVHIIGVLNSQEYIEAAQEAWVNSGNKAEEFWSKSGVLQDGLTEAQAKATNTDWIDATLRTGYAQEHNISLSGGADKTTFYVSGFLKDQKSILVGNDYKNFGARLNLDHVVNKSFTLGAKMAISHVDNKQVPSSWGGGVGSAGTMLPIWPIKKEDGTYYRADNNPVAQVELAEIKLKSNQFFGTWYARARIAEGLTLRSEYGLNLLVTNDYHYRPRILYSNSRANAATQIGTNTSWNWINSLNYQKKFNGHNLDLLVATEAQKSIRTENTALGDGFFNAETKYPQDAANKVLSYTQSAYSFNSYIGRINYDFKGKYLFSASMRADGSSRFAPESRWGYFPSGSIGYNLSEEAYFAPLKKVFNFMKVRASYGIVGNAAIGNNAYTTNYSSLTYNGNIGIFLSNLGDNTLGWEKTAQLDLGLTWEALNGRISGEFDYYNKRTTDLLLGYPVSQLTGVNNIITNAGILSNKGFDIMLNTVNIKKNNLTWETKITLNFNKNNMVEILPGLVGGVTIASGLGSTSLQPGLPVGIQQVVVWQGVNAENGQDMYLEQSTGSSLSTSQILAKYGTFNNFSNANVVFMGNPWPKYTGGLYNGFTWKNWDMNFLFSWSVGQEFILGDTKRYLSPFGTNKINPAKELIDNRWRKPGDIARMSQLTTENINFSNTTEHLYRTDYLRLKDLNIGYSFSGMKNSFLKGLRCAVRFSNLLTWTKAPDFFWDPEYAGVGFSNSNALSNDRGMPQAKFYTFSLSWNF